MTEDKPNTSNPQWVLTKQSSATYLRNYFMYVHEIAKSGNKFPTNLEEVWRIAYTNKGDAVIALKRDFIEGYDFEVFRRNPKNSQGGRPTEEYYLSTSCLEFFVARKVREVFEVYREVFHAALDMAEQAAEAVVKAEPKKPRTPQVSKARLEAEYTHIKFIDELLHIADSSKAMMINQIAEKYDLAARAPRVLAQDVPMSASDLLKKNGINMSAIKFNKIMTEHGFIEVHERKSKSAKSGVKHFPALTEKGLKYGSNVIDPKAQNQTQPLYNVHTFPILLDLLDLKPEPEQTTLFLNN